MKKLAIIMMVLCFCTAPSFANPITEFAKNVIKLDVKSKRIPAGRKIKIKFNESINSTNSHAGDTFSASLVENITVDDYIALPAGSALRGTISKIKPNTRLYSPAILYVTFDHIVTPTGRQIPITARVIGRENLTIEGGLAGGKGYFNAVDENLDKNISLIKDWTKKSRELGEEYLNSYPKYVTTPVGAIGSSLAGSTMFFGKSFAQLFMKGETSVISQNEVVDVILAQPLDIPLN